MKFALDLDDGIDMQLLTKNYVNMLKYTIIFSLLSCSLFGQNLYPMGDEFPLCLYALYADFEEAGTLGWNGSHTYQHAPVPNTYFITSAQNGLDAMARLSYHDSIGEKWSRPQRVTIDEITSQSQNQNLSWWDIPEELRYWYSNEYEIVQNYTRLTRLHDPLVRPNFMYIPGHYGSEGIENYVAYLDILPASCYTNWQELPHAYVRWSIEQTFQAISDQGYVIGDNYLGGEKTVMAILELFEGSIPLTEEGTWHDFWLALACDVKGILAFSHFYRNSSRTLTDSWNKLNEAIGIFKSENLDKTMLNGTTVPVTTTVEAGPSLTPSFDIDGDIIQFPSIKTIGKVWNDTLFVIAVNSASANVIFELDINDPTFNEYEDVFLSSHHTIQNATLVDTLSGLGVSFFKFYNSDVALPVEFLSFNGSKQEDNSALLTWETSSESGNRGFEVQKSFDGKNWHPIGFVKSHPSSNTYKFTDKSVHEGENYYRLKQLDFNGQFEYSKMITLSFYPESDVFSLYPNPTTHLVQVKTSLSRYDISILDSTGKLIQSHQNLSLSTPLDVSRLPAGIYSIELTKHSNGQRLKKSLVKY